MPAMFSLDEMRELALAFPDASSRAFPESDQEVRLVPSRSGDGFIRSDVLLQQLSENIETEGQGRLPLSQLATTFDVSKEVLSTLVRTPQAELLLSTDGQNVLSKLEADRLQRDLKELVEGRVVYAAGVAIANNLALESINKLVSLNRYGAKGEDGDGPRLALHPQTSDPREVRKCIIFSPSYLEELIADAHAAFGAAQQSGVPESVPPDGVLPTPFLQLMVDRLGSDFHGRFSVTEGTVDFEPTSYLESQRDEKMDELVDGATPSCSLQWLVDLLPEQYPDISSAERYINAQHPEDIYIFFDTAVSKAWHDRATADLLQTLRDQSLVNVSDPFQDLSPDAAHSAAAKAHADILAVVRQNEEDPNCKTISEGFFPYLIHIDLFHAIQDAFSVRVRAHAEHLWAHQDRLPEADLELGDVGAVLASVAQDELQLPPSLLAILLRCSCDGGARAVFNATLARLEADADTTLAAFWLDRVAARFALHGSAALAITDAKLRTQLLDLLREYVVKELVPDTVARAEAKGLVRSSRARRNVKRLLTALQEQQQTSSTQSGGPGGEQALAALRASLDKFAAKLDVPPLEVADLQQQRKEEYVRDMVRDMQKDSDAPRLFLKLVVALWAGHTDGVVYATGKFAPKLVKLLKGAGGLDEEQVARLEALKDAVKAGTVGDAEKAEMRKVAAEAWNI